MNLQGIRAIYRAEMARTRRTLMPDSYTQVRPRPRRPKLGCRSIRDEG